MEEEYIKTKQEIQNMIEDRDFCEHLIYSGIEDITTELKYLSDLKTLRITAEDKLGKEMIHLDISHMTNLECIMVQRTNIHLSGYSNLKKLRLLYFGNIQMLEDFTNLINLKDLLIDWTCPIKPNILSPLINLRDLVLEKGFNRYIDFSKLVNLVSVVIENEEYNHPLDLSNCNKLQYFSFTNTPNRDLKYPKYMRIVDDYNNTTIVGDPRL